jgi:hypothetical protein
MCRYKIHTTNHLETIKKNLKRNSTRILFFAFAKDETTVDTSVGNGRTVGNNVFNSCFCFNRPNKRLLFLANRSSAKLSSMDPIGIGNCAAKMSCRKCGLSTMICLLCTSLSDADEESDQDMSVFVCCLSVFLNSSIHFFLIVQLLHKCQMINQGFIRLQIRPNIFLLFTSLSWFFL